MSSVGMMLQHPFFTTVLYLEAKKALSSILQNVVSSEVSCNLRKCFFDNTNAKGSSANKEAF